MVGWRVLFSAPPESQWQSMLAWWSCVNIMLNTKREETGGKPSAACPRQLPLQVQPDI